MAVYVDDMRAPFGRLIMCHMVADTEAELHAMADKIGVDRKWYQYPKKSRYMHYDIALSKRALAVQFGAQEIRWRDAPAICRACLAYSKEARSDSKNTNGLATEAANPLISNENLAEWTGLEPATPGVTGPCANRATTGEKP